MCCGRGRARTIPHRQLLLGAQIGDLGVDSPAPQIPWKCTLRRDPGFREVAIPLRPHRGLRFREVQRIDDVATLPAIVRGVLSRS